MTTKWTMNQASACRIGEALRAAHRDSMGAVGFEEVLAALRNEGFDQRTTRRVPDLIGALANAEQFSVVLILARICAQAAIDYREKLMRLSAAFEAVRNFENETGLTAAVNGDTP